MLVGKQLHDAIELEILMYCTNCGKELSANPQFCENCGVKIQSSDEDDSNKETKPNADTSGIDVNVYPMVEPAPKKEPAMAQTMPLPSVNAKEESTNSRVTAEQSTNTQQRKKRNLLIIIIATLSIMIIALIVLLVLSIGDHEEITTLMSDGNNTSIQKTEKSETQNEREEIGSESSKEKATQDDSVNKSSVYVLPGSDSRYYSASELNDLSNYELYLARNEIFARHGREFKNQDLRDYFGSMSWYAPRYSGEEFDAMDLLNDYEKKNADTMLSIEQKRGSSYLN